VSLCRVVTLPPAVPALATRRQTSLHACVCVMSGSSHTSGARPEAPHGCEIEATVGLSPAEVPEIWMCAIPRSPVCVSLRKALSPRTSLCRSV